MSTETDTDIVSEETTSEEFGSGDWYVVHTYAGYENKVKANLESRISSMNMEEKIFEGVFDLFEDLEDLLLHVHGRDAALEVGLDLVLVARVGVDDVPVAGAELLAGGLLRNDVGIGLGGHGTPDDSEGLAAEDRDDELPEQRIQPKDDCRDHGHGDQDDHGIASDGATVGPVHLAQLGDDLAPEAAQPTQPRSTAPHHGVPARPGGLLAGILLLAQLLQARRLIGGALLASHRSLGFPVHRKPCSSRRAAPRSSTDPCP